VVGWRWVGDRSSLVVGWWWLATGRGWIEPTGKGKGEAEGEGRKSGKREEKKNKKKSRLILINKQVFHKEDTT